MIDVTFMSKVIELIKTETGVRHSISLKEAYKINCIINIICTKSKGRIISPEIARL